MSEQDLNTSLEPYNPANSVGTTDAPPAAANPLHLVQDRLQNRWKWVVLAGLILGPSLALTAYRFAPVKWAGIGYVQIDSQLKPLVDATVDTARLDDFSSFVSARATLMRSDRVLESVVRSTRSGTPPTGASTVAGRDAQDDIRILQQVFGQGMDDADAVAFLREGLTAVVPRGSSFIEVRFESSNPVLPSAVVNLVLDSFMEIYGPDAETEYTEQMAKIRGLATQVRLRLERFEEERTAVLKDADFFSPDLSVVLDARQERVQQLDSRLDAITALQKKIERQYRDRMIAASLPVNEIPPTTMLEPTNYELEQLDPRLAEIRRTVEDQRVLLDLAKKKYKPSHPALEKIAVEISGKESLLVSARGGALQSWREGVGSTQSYGALPRERDDLLTDRAAVRQGIERVNQVGIQLVKIDRSIASEQAELVRINDRLRELDREADSIRRGRVTVVEGASRRGSPESDKRVQLAAVGFAGGFILAFGAFFILGSVDPRAYRVSQLQKDSKAGRWLGVVPDMSAVGQDPAARELASNCVHRIRNKIEARRQQGNGYALMVTSPFQGDGKTTVAVALAWSYAESGHKTVLVDCDFIGRSLSHQFKKLHAPGVCEVLRRGNLANEVADIGENLSILPVGADVSFSASNLQIGALRRLMRTLREQYEIVIVDSGPVTASVEAIPVASSCDGAVLAIRHGRSRSRLPEAVSELTDTGVEYLGLVLNYADVDDCRRYGSISKMSAEVARALGGEHASATPHPLLTDRAGTGRAS